MTIDYDLLREILKRTTPGPWTVEDDGYDIIVADDEGHRLGWGEQVRFKFEAGDHKHDPALVALAPDMARELLRLRDGIEVIRDYCAGVTTARRSSGDPATEVIARELGAVDRTLADLLNGDTE